MAKRERVLRCYRCGTILQTKNPKEKGFISEEIYKKGQNDSIVYCDSCYSYMTSLNMNAYDLQVDDGILKILDDAVASDAVILWVIDSFTFGGVLNSDIAKKVKNLKVIVIANKFDLYPLGTKKESLKEYFTERFIENGIKPFAIRIIGNSDKADIASLLSELDFARQGHDVYMIGNSLSGKTCLINRMLKNYINKTNRPIRTFSYENTDIDVLEVPLTNSSFLYELPGISQNASLVNKVEKDVQKFIIPRKTLRIHPRVLLPNDYMIVGSLAAFGLVEGKATPIKFYSAEGVETKKVPAKKLEEALSENFAKRFVRPVSDRYANFTDFDVFDYYMENDDRIHDISIEGLGWISFKAQGQIIRVVSPKGAGVNESLGKIRK